MATLLDYHLLNSEVVTRLFPEKYNRLPKEFLTQEGQAICEDFGQEVAPLTVMADNGIFQKVLSAFVYPDPVNPKAFILNWVAGISIPLDPAEFEVSFDVMDIGGQPTKVVVVSPVGFADDSVAFPFKKENPLKGTGDKADKISSLELGTYTLQSVKVVATKFGNKTLLTIAGREFWANNQMNELLSIMGLLPNTPGDVKPINKDFRVVSKGTTGSGHAFARVGFI